MTDKKDKGPVWRAAMEDIAKYSVEVYHAQLALHEAGIAFDQAKINLRRAQVKLDDANHRAREAEPKPDDDAHAH